MHSLPEDAYPAYGMKYPGETALSVCHADGNLTLQMVVESVKETHLQEENATLTVIELKDVTTRHYHDGKADKQKQTDEAEHTSFLRDGFPPMFLLHPHPAMPYSRH